MGTDRPAGEPVGGGPAGDGATDAAAGPSAWTIVASIAAGFAVGFGATVTAVITVWLAGLLFPLAATLGGATAGYVARGGRLLGAVVGFLASVLVAAATVAAYLYVVSTLPPTPGVGMAVGWGFLLVVAGGVVTILCGTIGGVVGAAVRRKRRVPDVPERPDARPNPRSSRDVTAGTGHPVADVTSVDAADGHDGAALESRKPDASRYTSTDRSPATNVLVGGVVTAVLFFVPFSPLLGGAVTAYLEGCDRRRGALLGAAAGAVATALPALALLVVSLPVTAAGPVAALGFVSPVVTELGLYVVGFAAIGGAIGGTLFGSDRSGDAGPDGGEPPETTGAVTEPGDESFEDDSARATDS